MAGLNMMRLFRSKVFSEREDVAFDSLKDIITNEIIVFAIASPFGVNASAATFDGAS